MIPESYALERVDVSALSGFAGNPRTHSEAQVKQIAASIAEFGWTNPILVDATGTIIAGHGRLAAAKQLGLAQVPVIRLGHLSDAQRKALVIADNQLALNAGWDEAALSVLIQELDAEKFELDLLGFAADDLDRYLAGLDGEDSAAAEEAELPEVPVVATSRSGDLWILGNHRVLCGDATVADDYQKLLEGERVQMIWSDLPYNVNYANSAKDKLRGKHRPILNDNLGEDFPAFLQVALGLMLPRCNGAVYIAMSSSELDSLQAAFRAAGGKWSTFIIWAKNTFTLGRADYQRQYEPILYGWPEGAKRHWCGDRNQGDVWEIKKPARNDLHPTMKPIELMERSIRNSSIPGGTVLDPFGGSGSTLIAAEISGRHCRMMELDPRYVDVIVRRWQQFTGSEAICAGSQKSFHEVVSERGGSVEQAA